MRFLQGSAITKGNIALITAGILLIVFIGALVGANYLSQVKLQRSTLDHLRRDTEKRSMALGYFCSQRKDDITWLASIMEISAFFENRALGMSIEYGLMASLTNIADIFDRFSLDRKSFGDRIYTRIAFIESNGRVLVDRQLKGIKQKHEWDWKSFLMPESSEAAIVVVRDGQFARLIVSIPYFFKNTYEGQLMAWISPQAVHHLVETAKGVWKQSIIIVSEEGLLPLATDMQYYDSLPSLLNLINIKTGEIGKFEVIDKYGVKTDTLAIRVPVKDTPLSLVTMLPSSEVFGRLHPWHLPLALGALAIIILTGMAIVLRINKHKLIFHTRLEEASKKRYEIEDKNRQLGREIAIRKEAEKALRSAHEELEIRVEERTKELVKSNVLLKQEIKERKQAEKEKEKLQFQLLQAQKMDAIGTLAGGVAHDFNNILQSIQGFTDIALLSVKEDDPLYRNLNEVKKASTRAASLTRQLLLFSRRQTAEFTPLNLNTTVNNLLKMLHRLIGEDVTIKTELEPELWAVQADAGNIEQAIMNLTVNARDAMPEGGKIIINTKNKYVDKDYCKINRYARPGKFACLTIEDTGVGMDREIIPHIFDPFFTTKKPGKGTGMGLSVVYGILKQHDGWINVYSEPGQGSTFKMYLPASPLKPEEKLNEIALVKHFQGSGERILLVEDEDGVREFATRALGENGYLVYDAGNAKEAENIFEKETGNFALLFSDVVLPDKTGLELVDQLLSCKPDLRVLLSSGYTDQKSQWPVILERGFRFLQKPYTLIDLLRSLKETINRDK